MTRKGQILFYADDITLEFIVVKAWQESQVIFIVSSLMNAICSPMFPIMWWKYEYFQHISVRSLVGILCVLIDKYYVFIFTGVGIYTEIQVILLVLCYFDTDLECFQNPLKIASVPILDWVHGPQ
jgi:hypothetical protein